MYDLLVMGKGKLLPLFLLLGALHADELPPMDAHWQLVADGVYMRRTKLDGTSIINDSNRTEDQGSLVNTHQLLDVFSFEPGGRLSLSYLLDQKNYYELSFLSILEWTGRKEVYGNDSLFFPFVNAPSTTDFTGAQRATASLQSRLYSLELNDWCNFSCRREQYFSLSAIFGFRYFRLREALRLAFFHPSSQGNYDIVTKNHIAGLQGGLDLLVSPMSCLSWEAIVKGGVYGNGIAEHVRLTDLNGALVLERFKQHRWQPGVWVEALLSFAYWLTPVCNLHLGYQMLFLGQVALAPDQLSTSIPSPQQIASRGTALFYGLNGGLTLEF